MGRYIVTTGQNIYDVALHIYGSIEGIVDLMMNNTALSLCETLKAGDELLFTDDFVINNDIVSYYRMNSIVPSNGERTVYFKNSVYHKLIEIYINCKITTVQLDISGTGVLEIDWGDNSAMQVVKLSNQTKTIHHFFDNKIHTRRKICFYGDADFNLLDLSGLNPDSIFLLQPLYIERFSLNEGKAGIDFIRLFEGTFKIEMKKIRSSSLLPLIKCKKLMELDLSGGIFDQIVIDEYLISLVKEHYGRRNCTVTLTSRPSGEYHEPMRDANNNYIINYGMEAVWLLVNEPSWNEGGAWKFTIAGEVYCNI